MIFRVPSALLSKPRSMPSLLELTVRRRMLSTLGNLRGDHSSLGLESPCLCHLSDSLLSDRPWGSFGYTSCTLPVSGQRSQENSRELRAVFALTCSSCLCWNRWPVFRHSRDVLPQRFPPSCACRKGICRIDAVHGCRGGVPGNCEESTKQRRRRNHNFYLIGTGWLTARRREGETSQMDWVAMLIPLTVGILTWVNGIEVLRNGATSQNGVPVGMSFFMGSICLFAAVGDVRMLLHGGIFGVRRIARHLWRMCFGLFIAAGSFFLGPSNRPLRLLSAVGVRQHLPSAVFGTTLYLVLTILPLVLLIFWLARVRFTNTFKGKPMPPSGDVYSLLS
jgi:hypothetical protein